MNAEQIAPFIGMTVDVVYCPASLIPEELHPKVLMNMTTLIREYSGDSHYIPQPSGSYTGVLTDVGDTLACFDNLIAPGEEYSGTNIPVAKIISITAIPISEIISITAVSDPSTA
jgi:hypothetical protein